MARRVGVRSGVRTETNQRDVRAGALGDGLLQRDLDLRIPRIDKTAGADRHRDVEDAAHERNQSNCRARITMGGSSIRSR
jgi:hypothetical protein